MEGRISGRDYLVAAERNLRVARRIGGDGGRGLARLALAYLERAFVMIRAKGKEGVSQVCSPA